VADWQRVTTFPLISTLTAIGDPDGTRTVTSIVALLVAIGLALLLLAVWIFRRTRPDPELLAPLEAMGERSWRRGDPVWQRRRLDELRPRGARPLSPSVAPPELDASFDEGPMAPGFDDLRASDGTSSGEHPATEDAADALDAVPGTVGDGRSGDGPTPAVASDATPAGVVGPALEELPDDEFDPEALAAAREELERELAESRGADAAQQLDLFHRDQSS
jgi:hypothetical protein